MIIARHVDIVEENINLIGFKDDDGKYDYQDGGSKEMLDRNKGNDIVGTISCKLPSEQKITNCRNE